MTTLRLRRLAGMVAVMVALAAVYFVAGKLGLYFAQIHASASAVWPPTGIALAALLILGPRYWPAIFVGAFFVNVTTVGTILTSTGIAVGNTLEAAVGAWLVRRFAGGTACFERPVDIFTFAALAGVGATILSATIGVGTLTLGGLAPVRDFGSIWVTWWLGDAAGALIVTPLIVLWYRRKAIPGIDRRAEALFVLLTLIVVDLFVFLGSGRPLTFLCVPPLSWAAFRLGPRELATALVVQAVIAVWGTAQGSGPFATEPPHLALLILQGFLGTVTLTLLPIAVMVRQHRLALALAAAAGRAKDEFIGMLSHELRNPLQAISNAAYLLREPGGAGDAAMEIIRRQTEHLGRLVNDLLDVTRVIAGKTVLVRRPVNLADSLQHCLSVLSAAGRCEGRTVVMSAEPIWADADPERLDQVFSNLLGNALKYTAAGDRIRVQAQRDGDEAIVRFDDNGIGIAADLLPRMFDPFVQGEYGIDRSGGGLGIGLALVRRLVEQHGGRVEAQSAGPGLGSTFIVRLPALRHAPAGESMARRAAGAREPFAARTVLLVEDNADARNSLRKLLELLGHTVHTAEDGPGGVEAAVRLQPDIALIDIGLPGLDGYGVARELRSRGVRARLLAVTGYGRPEDRERAQAAGFDEHLVKPIALNDLQRVLTF